MARIAFENVLKRFGSTTAVAGFDLLVENGEFVVTAGPARTAARDRGWPPPGSAAA